jgi:hypothetical protein
LTLQRNSALVEGAEVHQPPEYLDEILFGQPLRDVSVGEFLTVSNDAQ